MKFIKVSNKGKLSVRLRSEPLNRLGTYHTPYETHSARHLNKIELNANTYMKILAGKCNFENSAYLTI